MVGGINDTFDQRSEGHQNGTPMVSGVIGTAHHRSVVSLIPPTTSQQCH
jgi:hypothetical protein